MEKSKEQGCEFFRVGTVKCGMALGLLGAALAALLLFLGFWKTLFIALFSGAGFLLGFVNHKQEKLKKLINRLFPPKGE